MYKSQHVKNEHVGKFIVSLTARDESLTSHTPHPGARRRSQLYEGVQRQNIVQSQ